jgi:hypothetical protein
MSHSSKKSPSSCIKVSEVVECVVKGGRKDGHCKPKSNLNNLHIVLSSMEQGSNGLPVLKAMHILKEVHVYNSDVNIRSIQIA